MGSWGTGVFGNDDAADWAVAIEGGGSVAMVREALEAGAEVPLDGYLEAPAGSQALAASEVVAAAAGRPTQPDAYSEGALAWGARQPELAGHDFLDLARRAVARVLSPNSELRELWLNDPAVDPQDAAAWTRAIEDLRRRLGED